MRASQRTPDNLVAKINGHSMASFTVKYQLGTYAGTISVNADENDDSETVIARAKKALERKAGTLPYPCYESWRVVERRD